MTTMPKKKSSDASRISRAYDELKGAYRAVKEAQRQTQEAYMSIVLRLAVIAEYRDPETGAHIMRISDLGCEVAKRIGLSEKELEVYRFASPLHDIGKIATPDSILKKTGKLTNKEREVMKEHTLIGFRMFDGSSSPILKEASKICRSHHEKWDGSGYPDGLKGEDIPLQARIVTLVDIFDALVSERCYKAAWPWDKAVRYIRENAGIIFDPRLTSAFLKSIPEIKKIYKAGDTIHSFVVDSGLFTEKFDRLTH